MRGRIPAWPFFMAAETIAESIQRAAVDGVHSVTVDGSTTTAMSIDEQIKAARYAAQQAATNNHLGLRFVKLMPPGGA